MRATLLSALVEEARVNDRLFLITPDMGYSVLEPFFSEFPERSLNTGIMEQCAIGFAAGLALQGRVPYVYSIVPFVTMRCFEQVRVDVAYMNNPVRLVGVGGGYTYGPAGPTHHSIEDLSLMRSLPNMVVCSPCDRHEVKAITEMSFNHPGPMYIRLGRNNEPDVHHTTAKLGIGHSLKVRDGCDAAILATGTAVKLALLASEGLASSGIEASVYSMPFIKPFDNRLVERLAGEGTPIFTLEEHSIIGGLGSATAEVLAESDSHVLFRRLGIADHYHSIVGSQNFLREKDGLLSVDATIKRILAERPGDNGGG
jgi:transketolase